MQQGMNLMSILQNIIRQRQQQPQQTQTAGNQQWGNMPQMGTTPYMGQPGQGGNNRYAMNPQQGQQGWGNMPWMGTTPYMGNPNQGGGQQIFQGGFPQMPFNINLAALLGRGVGTGMPQTGNIGRLGGLPQNASPINLQQNPWAGLGKDISAAQPPNPQIIDMIRRREEYLKAHPEERSRVYATGSQPFGVNQPLMNIGGGMQNPMQGMGMQNIQQRMSESPRMNYGQSLNSNPVRLGSTMNTNAYRKGFVR